MRRATASKDLRPLLSRELPGFGNGIEREAARLPGVRLWRSRMGHRILGDRWHNHQEFRFAPPTGRERERRERKTETEIDEREPQIFLLNKLSLCRFC
jgi:hypothetical protein